MKSNQPIVNRGDVYYANLSPSQGSEQGGSRPAVVVSNDVGNNFSPVIIVAPITSKVDKKRLPTQVELNTDCGLSTESIVMCEQLRTIDKARIMGSPLGWVSFKEMKAIEQAIKISLEM